MPSGELSFHIYKKQLSFLSGNDAQLLWIIRYHAIEAIITVQTYRYDEN